MECFIKKYLQHGLIEPGYEKLSFTLGDRTYRADVLSDGTILDENSETFGDVPEWVTKCVNNAIATPGQILSIVKYGETPLSAFEQIFATTSINPKPNNATPEYEMQNRRHYILPDVNPYNINSPQFSPLPSPLPSSTPPLPPQQQQSRQHMHFTHRRQHFNHNSFPSSSSSSMQLSSIKSNKNRYVTHLHNSVDYFKLGFEKGIFRGGKNNLRYKSDTIDVLSSLDENCHVTDENNNYFNSIIDWIKSIANQNNSNNNNKVNKVNWKNLYYNDKNLSDYEDLILNGSKDKVEEMELEDETDDTDDDSHNNEIEEEEEEEDINNNNNNSYYTNDKFRNETRPPASCYYNNDISSSGSDKSDDNCNNNNSINKLPSDDDEINNNNNSIYYRNIQEKMEDFDDDYSFMENSKVVDSNELNNDLYKLIKQKHISPGVDILELRHNGCCYRASLMKNGKIRTSDGMKYDDIKSWSRSLTSETLCLNDLMNSIYYKSSPIKDLLAELKNQRIVN